MAGESGRGKPRGAWARRAEEEAPWPDLRRGLLPKGLVPHSTLFAKLSLGHCAKLQRPQPLLALAIISSMAARIRIARASALRLARMMVIALIGAPAGTRSGLVCRRYRSW